MTVVPDDAGPDSVAARRRRLVLIAGVLAAVIAVGATLTWFFVDNANKRTVPDLAGKSSVEATRALAKAGLKAALTTPENLKSLPDRFTVVDAQSPKPGTVVYKELVVDIEIGGAETTVPDIDTSTFAEAEQLVNDAGLELEHDFGSDVPDPAWPVASQTPASGTKIKAGSSVAVTLNAPDVIVPELVGLAVLDAKRMLGSSRLKLTAVGAGPFISSSSVAAGTAVRPYTNIQVDSGVKMPSVVGLSVADATAALKNSGISKTTWTSRGATIIAPSTSMIVQAQSIAPGSVVKIDTQVALDLPEAGTTYRVTGNGSSAAVTWSPPGTFSIQQDTAASLPWEQHFATDGGHPNFNAQTHDGDSITCSVIVNGKVTMERTSTGPYAVVSCG